MRCLPYLRWNPPYSYGAVPSFFSLLTPTLLHHFPTGAGKSSDVFVIGATNRPDLLDSSLLRPGRFDRLLYLGSAQDPASRLSVLQASTRKFQLAEGVDMQAVVDCLPLTFTGADFSAVASQVRRK